MMINNNPYNLPDRPSQKSGRIYTQMSSAQYRKNDSLDNSQSFTQSSARNQNNNGMASNMMMKKSSINIDDPPSNYRPPIYPGVKNDFKHYLPSPKNQSSGSNISNFSNLSSQRNSFNYRSEQKDTSSTQLQNSSMYPVEMKEIQEKIQTLQYVVKCNEKKISELEKNYGGSFFLPNNSAINNEDSNSNNNFEVYSNMVTRIQAESKEQFTNLRDSIDRLRSEIRKINENQQLQISQHNSSSNKLTDSPRNYQVLLSDFSDKFHKEITQIRSQLDQKINLNHEFLTSVISRVERQIHSNVNQIPPTYKSSAIRCSGSAILLRFVECFKVRKNTSANKMGEIKIVLTDNTYYIDNQGYLLDKEQHYLIDARGNQVRLEEKHVKLLRDQRVLM